MDKIKKKYLSKVFKLFSSLSFNIIMLKLAQFSLEPTISKGCLCLFNQFINEFHLLKLSCTCDNCESKFTHSYALIYMFHQDM